MRSCNDSCCESPATVPWALPGSRFTLPFERRAIDVLLETNVGGGARLLNLSWDEAWHLIERAVERGEKAKKRRVIPYLGVDEKAVARRHQYVTMVCDLDRGTVEYLVENRGKTYLDAYYASLSREQLTGIQAAAMDMWDPYIASTISISVIIIGVRETGLPGMRSQTETGNEAKINPP